MNARCFFDRAGLPAVAALLLTSSGLAACGTSEGNDLPSSICPTCQPNAGGETSDFPMAELHECAMARRMRDLSLDEVEALPYVEPGLRDRIEQVIDMPMRWEMQEAQHSQAAGSYEPETRVHVTTRILAYRLDELDPALCSDTSCMVGNVEFPTDFQACGPMLRIDVEQQLRTADGAVEATIEGEVVVIAQGTSFDEPLPPGEVHCHGYLDLREVKGSLRIELDEPRRALLLLQTTYDSQGTSGVVWPRVVLSDVGAGTFDSPLRGEWGHDF